MLKWQQVSLRVRNMVDQITTYVSVAEYEALPDSEHPIELIGGELSAVSPPSFIHQVIVVDTSFMLKQLRPDGRTLVASLSVYLDEKNVLEPDVLWIAPVSQATRLARGVKGAPDLIIEVLSPSTARYDKIVKFQLYEKHGTQEYWIIEPERQQVEVWKRDGTEFVLFGTFGPSDSFDSPTLERTVDLKTIFTE